jgi:Brp/Blh family beta-carotene 15,15'-monooxygenase
MLTGDNASAVLADLMLLVAPVACAVGLAGIGALWKIGRRKSAVSAGCALAATLLLPPVAGFALFFCLVHSPMQFRRHSDSLGLRGFKQWGSIVVPLSLGGLGIAAAVLILNNNASLAAGVFAGSFMTLSILTVPHMLVPIVAGLRAPRRQLAVIWPENMPGTSELVRSAISQSEPSSPPPRQPCE